MRLGPLIPYFIEHRGISFNRYLFMHPIQFPIVCHGGRYLTGFIFANMIEDISKDLGVSQTFCYVIIVILALTVVFAIISWIIGGRRRKKELKELNKKTCPACGGDNEPDALLCRYCEEML